MKTITLHSAKYNGDPHWCWQAQLLAEGADGWVCYHPPDIPIATWAGECRASHYSLYQFWPDRWYNVVRAYGRAQGRPFFYCNIITPPARDSQGLHWCDLDLDVKIEPDGSIQVMDEEEFAANADKYGYPPEVRARAQAAVITLLDLARRREPPFEFDLSLEEPLARWGLFWKGAQ